MVLMPAFVRLLPWSEVKSKALVDRDDFRAVDWARAHCVNS